MENNASCAPRRSASVRAARLTAYEVDFTPASSQYVAPSTAARYATAGLASVPGRRPTSAPVASGQLGERSPVRYGRNLTPSHPGGTDPASLTISS